MIYEVDYLPENDRVEVKAGPHIKGKTKKKQKADASKQIKLF
jgi:hypothetical protein